MIRFDRKVLLAGLIGLGWVLSASAVGAEGATLCGPFDGPDYQATPARFEAEVASAAQEIRRLAQNQAQAEGRAEGRSGLRAREGEKGEIVQLPDRDAVAAGADPAEQAERPSEALLALPKDESGAIPTDFELGPDVRIATSFFSPVLCATVARVQGPPGASLEELVTVVPEAGIVVRNDVYASAAAEVERLESPDGVADPYTSLQYGLAATGVRAARGLGDGTGVRIALLDSAPEPLHRDLQGLELRPLPEAAAAPTTGVHGTLMAGVISATENNGFGIAGVAPGADLVSIPVCEPTRGVGGSCTIYALLRGLDLAQETEARIVNLSLTGPPNPLLERGVARLDELGLVVVAAAGNESSATPRFPAAYPTVIAVGAVDREGQAFPLSNRGPWVELVAPGVEVLSTVPGNAFAFGDGTSLAAAHVTGVLAVLTGLTEDPRIARAELFRAAHSRPSVGLTPALPEICEVIERLGQRCP